MTAITANFSVADLLAQHRTALLSYARHLYRNADRAEDAVQDAFRRAFENLHRFDNQRGLAWLRAILRNDFRSFKKMKRYASANHYGEVSSGHVADYADEIACPASQSDHVELMDALHTLARMGADGTALLQSALGSPHADIARDTATTADVVKQRVSRGRTRLKTALGEAN